MALWGMLAAMAGDPPRRRGEGPQRDWRILWSRSEELNLSRRPSTFRQTDLTRALRGARAAGIEIARVAIDKDGSIILVVAKPTEESGDVGGEHNEWDAVK
jgi:hypothetical protein